MRKFYQAKTWKSVIADYYEVIASYVSVIARYSEAIFRHVCCQEIASEYLAMTVLILGGVNKGVQS